MSEQAAELQPDTEAVLQEEAPEQYQAIPVCVKEVSAPVRVQQLPRKGAASLTKSLTTTATQVLWADHWRGRVVLLASADVLVAFSEASCQADSAMAAWPANVPLEITATAEIWAKAATGTASLSVITERWAEGQ
jgi:hypothetical protein